MKSIKHLISAIILIVNLSIGYSQCFTGVSPTSVNFDYLGGQQVITVQTSDPSCDWIVSQTGSWFTYTSDFTTKQIIITATQNNTSNSRSGEIILNTFLHIPLNQSVCTSPPAVPGAITGPTEICFSSGTSYDFSIASVNGANGYTWSATGGNVVYGQNSPNAVISFSGSGSKTVSVTANNSCGSSPASTFNVAIYDIPTTANAGSDFNGACGDVSCALAANTPSAGTGAWSIISGSGGSFSTPVSSPTNTFNGTDGESYTLRWTIANAICTSMDDKIVSFPKLPNDANAGIDIVGSETCGLTSITLSANNPSGGCVGNWAIISGTSGSLGDMNSPSSSFTGVGNREYRLRWTISSVISTCSSADDIYVKFNVQPMKPFDVNDLTRCGPGEAELQASTAGLNVRWYNVSTGGAILATGLNYSPTVTSTSSFYAATYNDYCESADRVSGIVTVKPIPNGGTLTVTPDKVVPNEMVELQLTGDVGTLHWDYSGDGINWSTHGYFISNPQSIRATYGVKYFRAKLTDNGIGCTTDFSNIVNVDFEINPNDMDLPYQHYYPDDTKNYVEEMIPQIALDESIFDQITAKYHISEEYNFDAIRHGVAYYDGLGRPVQQIDVMGGVFGNDLVSFVEYDEFGREKKKFLPLNTILNNQANTHAPASFINDVVTKQELFYTDFITSEPNAGLVAFSETEFDNSPLNHVMEQGAPGAAWQINKTDEVSNRTGHTVKYDYETNINADNVVLYEVNVNDELITGGTGFYPETRLYKTITYDENWETGTDHTTEEYKNKQGQVVLKRTYNGADVFDTYYVYDDFGLLRYVIPPLASVDTRITSTPLDKDSEVIKDLCYYYEYDDRNRMIEKQLPGAKPVYMIYDKRDRLVATQDGELRNDDKWLFTKYDVFNRPVLTGLYTYYDEPDDLQTDVNEYSDNMLFEQSGTTVLGYTNKSFPDVENENGYLTATYYDTYPAGYDATFYEDNIEDTDWFNADLENFNTKGLVTCTKTKVLDGNQSWITTVNFYDEYNRVLANYVDNEFTLGTDIIVNEYDFVGKVLKTKHVQTVNIDDETETTTQWQLFEYDHAGRLVSMQHKIGDDPLNPVELAHMEYNALGELVDKKLHTTAPGNNHIQSVDYEYNIRGWLTGINDPDDLSTEDDLFAMKLLYQDVSDLTGITANGQYNGNISGAIWKDNMDADLKAYSYGYDAINRITAADFATNNGTWNNTDAYDVTGYDYDLNGNIKALTRNWGEGTPIDGLTYDYGTGNQLQYVQDTEGDIAGISDYVGDNTMTVDYDYDDNGNMKTDAEKGITVAYNYLNLPETVTFENGITIEYIYDAAGTKLAKITPNGMRYYLGNMEYDEDGLALVHHDEGFVKVTNEYIYQYYIKDHLGNTRVTFTDNPNALAEHITLNQPLTENTVTIATKSIDLIPGFETAEYEFDGMIDEDYFLPGGGSGMVYITQRTDYYPFGMAHEMPENSSDNKYLYNGKELQDEMGLDWYDYGARFYDPSLGRWHTQDPLAEWYMNQSPYNYCLNNPINYIDPDGMRISKEDRQRRREARRLARRTGGKFNRWRGKGENKGKRYWSISYAGGKGDADITTTVYSAESYDQAGGTNLYTEGNEYSKTEATSENEPDRINYDEFGPAFKSGRTLGGIPSKDFFGLAKVIKKIYGIVKTNDKDKNNDNQTSDQEIVEKSTGEGPKPEEMVKVKNKRDSLKYPIETWQYGKMQKRVYVKNSKENKNTHQGAIKLTKEEYDNLDSEW